MLHQSNGSCGHCLFLMNKYSGFNKQLQLWFFGIQARYPYTHISCAGRNYQDQMAAFKSGASHAVYGKSAHNYNCAIDVFFTLQGVDNYDDSLFDRVIMPNMAIYLNWYGSSDMKARVARKEPGSFYEKAHIEINSWRTLVTEGLVHLVEPEPPI